MQPKWMMLLGLLGLLAGACAPLGIHKDAPVAAQDTEAPVVSQEEALAVSEEEALRRRVELYWQSIMKDDLVQAYLMEEPAFREKVPARFYMEAFGPASRWKSVEIRDIEIAGDDARVRLDVRLITVHAQGRVVREQKKTLEENWVRVDNQWYHVFKRN